MYIQYIYIYILHIYIYIYIYTKHIISDEVIDRDYQISSSNVKKSDKYINLHGQRYIYT